MGGVTWCLGNASSGPQPTTRSKSSSETSKSRHVKVTKNSDLMKSPLPRMHIAQLPEPRTVLPNSFEDFAEIANNGKIFYSFTPEYCESLEIFFTKHCIKGQLEVLLNMLHLV